MKKLNKYRNYSPPVFRVAVLVFWKMVCFLSAFAPGVNAQNITASTMVVTTAVTTAEKPFVARQSELLPLPSKGTIRRFENFTSRFVEPRNVDVWLPEAYLQDVKKGRFAVLYMHDGQMLFDSSITWNKQEWRVDEVLSALLDSGLIRNCIVVGVWNKGKMRHSEYFPAKPFYRLPQQIQDSLLNSALGQKVQSDAYLKFIVEELKPHIDSVFETEKGVESTFIAGSSMGGLISIYAIAEYPHIFGAAACLSTHWVGNIAWKNDVIPQAIAAYLEQSLLKGNEGFARKIYFDYGTKTLDSLYKPYQIRIDELMKRKNYDSEAWLTKEFIGEDHSERAWAKRLAIPMKFVLKPLQLMPTQTPSKIPAKIRQTKPKR